MSHLREMPENALRVIGRLRARTTPHSVNTFLVDGQVAGRWCHEEGDIRLAPFGRLAAADRRAVEEEAHGLALLHAE